MPAILPTNATSLPSDAPLHQDAAFAWILALTLVGLLLYALSAALFWPYARPLLPIWILLCCILFPPLLPFAVFYVVFAVGCLAPVRSTVVVVRETATPRPAAVRPRPATRGHGV